MSDPFEQVDFVRIFFKDGSCAFLKNHKRDVNEIITQLTDERAALKAENERLRKAGEAFANDLRDHCADEEHELIVAWEEAKGVQS